MGARARRLGGPGLRRGLRGGNATLRPLEAIIASILGSGVQRFFHSLDPSKFDSATAVGSWTPSIGSGAATQGTGTVKPAYTANAINSRPALLFDSGDLLETLDINLGAFERGALAFVVQVTGGAGLYTPGYFADASMPGHMGQVHREAANRVSARARGAAASAETRGTPFPLTTASVVTATADYTLTSHVAEIRVNGVNVSSTYASDPDLSAVAGLANGALYIGNRPGADLGITGYIAAVLLCGWTTAVPTTQLAAAERALMSAYGIP